MLGTTMESSSINWVANFIWTIAADGLRDVSYAACTET